MSTSFLTAFTAGLLLITISELGDKTFFIAVILAMRYSRRLVFSAVISALALMTIISVFLGQALSILPKIYTHYGTIILFLIFGIKLLLDAQKMPKNSEEEIIKEASEAIETQEAEKKSLWGIKFLENFPNITLWIESFVLTFIAEWGDRTQISTIALAAANNPVGVTLGAILGHAICTIIAVIGGKLIAGRISERMVTIVGGILFLIFGIVAYFQGVETS